MELTTFSGDLPIMSDVVIAKNYLTEEELKILNNLVSGYFDFAEIQAIRHNKAIKKAKVEYKKYQVKTISPVEKDYLETLKAISNKIDDKAKSE